MLLYLELQIKTVLAVLILMEMDTVILMDHGPLQTEQMNSLVIQNNGQILMEMDMEIILLLPIMGIVVLEIMEQVLKIVKDVQIAMEMDIVILM